ncbi:MAG: phosphoribosyl-ATP diphosphatase [Pseudomonadota bacterium]|nr:phosphoribosyl-ATP diphosphatase [Pseudomonadota bacterium]
MTELTGETLDQVFETIAKRHCEFKAGKVGNSRTAKLFKRGSAKIAQKLGEEAVETVIEAIKGRKGHLIEESADLLYFLLVTWKDHGIEPEDVWKELKKRHKLPEAEERAGRLD